MTSLGIQDAPETTPGGIRVPMTLLYVLLMLVGWGISGFVGYAAAQSAMNARVSVLESEFQGLRSDVSDIRTDVKTLLSRK